MMPEPGFQNPILYWVEDRVRIRNGYAHAVKSYLRSRSAQKVINLSVGINGALKIGDTANLGLNQVVAVNGSRDGSPIHSGGHELQDRHLDEMNQRYFEL